MPDQAATDDCREIHLLGQTAAVLFISQEIGGQRQSTPSQDRDQTLVAEFADRAIQRHGGNM